jgi:serine/threonine-protein kinase RsbW
MINKKELSIQSIYEKVAEACYSLRDFCSLVNIEKKVCSELELCLTEALNNVIKHAYEENPEGKIDLEYSYSGIELEIKIEDEGRVRTNFAEPALVYDPSDINSLPEGGMGLFIIKNLMDFTAYEREEGKNRFIMKKII